MDYSKLPWSKTNAEDEPGGLPRVYGHDNLQIAEFHGEDNTEREANAQLFYAAPALLKACRKVVEQNDCRCDDGYRCSVCLCAEAIEFAGGERSTNARITKQQFLRYFNSPAYHEDMDVEECREVFLNSLVGSSDLTGELLHELCSNYNAGLPLKELLAADREIAVTWAIDDVRCVRNDLNDDQAWSVLQRVRECHNAELGINWDVLEYYVNDMFPEPAAE